MSRAMAKENGDPKPRAHLVAQLRSRIGGHTLASAAIAVGALTLVAKLTAAAKDVVVARKFGTGPQVDAYYIAFALPSLILNVMAGTIQSSFVPAFVQLKEREGRAAAQRLVASSLMVLIAAVLMCTLILAMLAPVLLPLLAAGFSATKLALSRRLLYLLIPTLLLNGLGAGFLAALNANESFRIGALIAVVNPGAAVICIAALSGSIGIYAVITGTLVGFALEATLLAVAFVRHGWSPIPKWHGMDPWVRRLIWQSIPMLAASAMAAGNGTVDQAMAGGLGSGSVATMTYGLKITTAVQLMSVTAIGTVVLPHYARLADSPEGSRGLQDMLRRQSAILLVIVLPITLLLTLGSGEVVHLVFQGGHFSPRDAHVVARVQVAYAVQMPFYALGILGVRALSALQANASVMRIGLVNLVANLLADLVGRRLYGVVGIALATSVVYVGSFVMIAFTLRRKLRDGDVSMREARGE